jgi:hypothetical protein
MAQQGQLGGGRWAAAGLLLLLLLVAVTPAAAPPVLAPSRAVMSLNDGWRFSRTEADAPEGDCSSSSSSSSSNEPCQPAFDDAGWRALSRLPHDFVVEAPLVYSEDSVAKNQGYRAYGKAWYRLKIALPQAWSQRRSLWIDFDGIAGWVFL